MVDMMLKANLLLTMDISHYSIGLETNPKIERILKDTVNNVDLLFQVEFVEVTLDGREGMEDRNSIAVKMMAFLHQGQINL